MREHSQLGEKALGNRHPQVLSSLRNLAELYKTVGRWDEAARLEERAKVGGQ
jgi:hypothetical protein